MALEIKRTVLMDTLNLVVEFEPVEDPDLAEYHITATDGDYVVEATSTDTIVRLPRVKPGKLYSVQVAALNDDSEPLVVGDSVDVDTTLTTTNARILRQQIVNILKDAGLTVGPHIVRIYSDKYGRPRSLSENDSVVKTPAIIVEYPITRISAPASVARHSESLEVELNFIDTVEDEDSGFARLDMMFAKVRHAINATKNLGLAWLGVVDQSWTWTCSEPDSEDKLVAQTAILRVDLPQVVIGQLPYVSAPHP